MSQQAINHRLDSASHFVARPGKSHHPDDLQRDAFSFNPRWTPHAKFHKAQTMLLGLGLGVSALWFVWRRKGDSKTNLLAAVIFAAVYWITQALSITFPGTALFDLEFDPGSLLPLQLMMDVVLLALLGAAYYLESGWLTEY